MIKAFVLFFTLCSLVFANTDNPSKPDLFLLKTYDNNQDVTAWVMSEKYDGIRGFWNGKQLLTRSGKVIAAPTWFLKDYPPFAIDGELWTKRGDFENISSIVRQKIPDNRWKNISHQIFEIPNQTGGLLERLAVLKHYLKTQPNSPIRLIKQIPIEQQSAVQVFLNQVTHQGGEGVVVRNPSTLYQTGRLNSALKVKPYFDTECSITKILLGKGKYIDKMGSVLCQTSTGKTVKIGTGFTDFERQNPPNVGDEVTFKYYGFTKNGKFRFPVFLRVRDKK